jgi:hypothetical protein
MRTTLILCVLAAACGDNLEPQGAGDPDAGFEPWELEELTADQGFWVRTPEFEVPAGEEIQDCYFFEVPDLDGGNDLSIDRLQLALNPGSHHMNLFRVGTIYDLDPADGAAVDMGGVEGVVIEGGECWKSPNWRDWPLVANNQQSPADDPIFEWALPEDVAQKFAPGERLMLQIHYVNATTQTTPYQGRGAANLYRSQEEDPIELGTMFATQQSIRICRSQPEVSYTSGCSMPAGVETTVVAANGHFHSRGRRFAIHSWDGLDTDPPAAEDMFYESDSWEEPEMATGLDVPLVDGGGIRWICDFEWYEPDEGCAAVDERDPQQAGDCCFTFGPTVETSEHCNVFMYYYPKVERTDITCF